MSTTLAPSILAADFANLERDCRRVLAAGAHWLHLDVMDGRFVPNISFGIPVVRALRALADETGAQLDTHLMIVEPEKYVDAFAAAGADLITVHVEACTHLNRVIQQIKDAGALAGVSLNPATPIVMLEEVIELVDLVLVMSVNPGFGGQRFIRGSMRRVRAIRDRLGAVDSRAYVSVDGGVDANNAGALVGAGANVLVAGSAIFNGPKSVEENVAAFKQAVDA